MAEDPDLIKISAADRTKLEKAGNDIIRLRKNIAQLKIAGLPWEDLQKKVEDMDKIRRGILNVF